MLPPLPLGKTRIAHMVHLANSVNIKGRAPISATSQARNMDMESHSVTSTTHTQGLLGSAIAMRSVMTIWARRFLAHNSRMPRLASLRQALRAHSNTLAGPHPRRVLRASRMLAKVLNKGTLLLSPTTTRRTLRASTTGHRTTLDTVFLSNSSSIRPSSRVLPGRNRLPARPPSRCRVPVPSSPKAHTARVCTASTSNIPATPTTT